MKTNSQRYIHPFPARMAPEIAIDALYELNCSDTILDPMVGSGTVLHHAALKGINTIGFDLDPLAILISRVRTNKINISKYDKLYSEIVSEFEKLKDQKVKLDWIDTDDETMAFIKFWFANKQIKELRKISYVFDQYKSKRSIELDALRIAFSRIIITKKVGASLAWDISHSRPHKVRTENDFNVFAGFEASVKNVKKWLVNQDIIQKKSKIVQGDARRMRLPDNSVDKVITSPPYLNAIDYMRGHKFSLIWLGYKISDLRLIRSNSIGAEKKLGSGYPPEAIDDIYNAVLKDKTLIDKQSSMIKRYIKDSIELMVEISRVLKKGKKAVFVVGNSNLSGVYIENSEFFNHAGKIVGLMLEGSIVREIPIKKRYLPISLHSSNSLSKRMKHEVIMTFINKKNTSSSDCS